MVWNFGCRSYRYFQPEINMFLKGRTLVMPSPLAWKSEVKLAPTVCATLVLVYAVNSVVHALFFPMMLND